MEYQRLGDYIREVNVRNRDLKVTKLVGLTIDKAFISSVANVIGTDLSNYKVIHREQREKLLRQIESLEKQCRTEKQTRKKYELHQQIIKLKEKLK